MSKSTAAALMEGYLVHTALSSAAITYRTRAWAGPVTKQCDVRSRTASARNRESDDRRPRIHTGWDRARPSFRPQRSRRPAMEPVSTSARIRLRVLSPHRRRNTASLPDVLKQLYKHHPIGLRPQISLLRATWLKSLVCSGIVPRYAAWLAGYGNHKLFHNVFGQDSYDDYRRWLNLGKPN